MTAKQRNDTGGLDILGQHLLENEHVEIYTNTFDDTIHEELKRQRRVINHSLNGLFEHSEAALKYGRGESNVIL